MATPMSIVVDLHQADFSVEPPYSIDNPPEVIEGIDLLDEEVDLLPEMGTLSELTNHRTESSLLAPHHSSKNWTPSFYWEDETNTETDFSKKYFRSIAPIVLSNLYSNKDLYSWLNKSVECFSLLNYPKAQRVYGKVMMHEASLDYFAILLDNLIPLSFLSSEEYEDVFGGRVVDYFRGVERISCIVSMEHVQILSFVNNVFGEKIFERVITSKPAIVKYLEDLFSGRKIGIVESTEQNK